MGLDHGSGRYCELPPEGLAIEENLREYILTCGLFFHAAMMTHSCRVCLCCACIVVRVIVIQDLPASKVPVNPVEGIPEGNLVGDGHHGWDVED